MKVLNKTYKIVTGFVLALGILFLVFSLRLPFGSFQKPKAGFIPTVFSVLWVFFGAISFVVELFKEDKVPSKLENINWVRFILYVVDCLLYMLFLKVGGFIFSTAICLYLLIKISGLKGQIKPILVSVIFSVGFWAIFTFAMNVKLPKPFFM